MTIRSSRLQLAFALPLICFLVSGGIAQAQTYPSKPIKLVLPVGFALMALQGVSEIIKRVAALEHLIDADFKYEKPLQ